MPANLSGAHRDFFLCPRAEIRPLSQWDLGHFFANLKQKFPISGFYTKLNVWGSLGLNFDYDGGPIIENGGPIFLYKRRILGGSTSFREGIGTGLSCQTGVTKHQVIFASQPFVAT